MLRSDYVDEEGLGVNVDAETYTTLIQLARLGFEMGGAP